MKILLIVDDYLPGSVKIAGKMMHELAVELRANGHDVTVLTPTNVVAESGRCSTLDGVTVLRFFAGELKNTSMLRRAINESLLSRRAWIGLKSTFQELRQDRIVYYSPSIFWGGIVGKLKRLWSCDSYLILRDLFPQWAVDAGVISPLSPAYWYFRAIERQCYRAADVIGVQSPANRVLLRRYEEKTEVLYNWTKGQTARRQATCELEKLGLEGKVVFFYGGNIGHAQDMMNILRLAENMATSKNAHFLLVGRGDEFAMLQREIELRELSNINLIPAVPQDRYFSLLSECHVGLLSLHPSHKAHNFPGKLLGYMEVAKPILASVNRGNDLADMINSSQAGFCLFNGEDEALLDAAVKLADSSELRRQMGRCARQLMETKFSVAQAVRQVTSRKPA